MKRIKLDDIKSSDGATNWAAVKQQTDSDIEKKSMYSAESKLLTELELAQLRRASIEQSRGR